MTGDYDKLVKLLAYAKAEGRICQELNALWDTLPRRERVGGGWNTPLPLILGAWWHISAMEKQLRLRDHIEYAAAEGVLIAAYSYLGDPTPAPWYTMEDR